MIALNVRLWLAIGVVLASLALMVGTAFVQGKSTEPRPGWGFGNDNRVHTGPPGQTVKPAP